MSSEWLDPRLFVVAACGASAGIHAGLVPDHWEDSAALGVLLALAAAGLVGAATALAVWPEASLPAFLAAGLFAALIASWVAAGGVVDAIGVVTKVVEAAGLVLAVVVLRRPVTRPGDLALAYFGLPFVLAFTIAASAGH